MSQQLTFIKLASGDFIPSSAILRIHPGYTRVRLADGDFDVDLGAILDLADLAHNFRKEIVPAPAGMVVKDDHRRVHTVIGVELGRGGDMNTYLTPKGEVFDTERYFLDVGVRQADGTIVWEEK